MINIYLLKTYKGKRATSVIEVDDNVASELVETGIARYAKGRDYLVKPEFSKKGVNAKSKAFKRSPKFK